MSEWEELSNDIALHGYPKPQTKDACLCGSPRPLPPAAYSIARTWECGWCGRCFASDTNYGGWVEYRGPVKRGPHK
jgi:hypothetical protein